jgi:hypothetical protein
MQRAALRYVAREVCAAPGFCACCGGAMTLHTDISSVGREYRYYTCSTKVQQGAIDVCPGQLSSVISGGDQPLKERHQHRDRDGYDDEVRLLERAVIFVTRRLDAGAAMNEDRQQHCTGQRINEIDEQGS